MNPFSHAEQVTGRKQLAVVDAWGSAGLAVTLSMVSGPWLYEFGAVPATTLSLTLYPVSRHVLRVDGRTIRDDRVAPGRFRIAAPNRHIEVDATPAAAGGKLLLIYFRPELLTELMGERADGRPLRLREVAWDEEDLFLQVSARRLAAALEAGRGVDRMIADQIALTLGWHLIDAYGIVPRPQEDDAFRGKLPRSVLARVDAFIRAELESQPSLREIAAVAGLSPHHFLRQFRATTGETPFQFLRKRRIELAQSLIAGGETSLVEIALRCGFSSQAHLATAIKAETGLTPSQLRRSTR